MIIFITDHPEPEEDKTSRDTEGARAMGFCDFCCAYDKMNNLHLFHPIANRAAHITAHLDCIREDQTRDRYEFCVC